MPKYIPDKDSHTAYIRKHNSLLGNVGIARVHIRTVRQSSSASAGARGLIGQIEKLLWELEVELRTVRIEEMGQAHYIEPEHRTPDSQKNYEIALRYGQH